MCRFVNEAIRHLIGRHGIGNFPPPSRSRISTSTSVFLSAFRSGNAARARRVMLDHMLSAEAVIVPRSNRRADQPALSSRCGSTEWQRRLHCALEEMKMIGHGKQLLSAATKPAIAGKR